MSNPLGLPALISPYVGGKSGGRYFIQAGGVVRSRICDRPHYYDCIVEPFAGSGAATWQHNHGIAHTIAADVDPGVQAVWECWREHRDAVNGACELWHREITEGSAKRAFNKLKRIYDKKGFHGSLRFGLDSTRRYELAAAYLTLKRLVFGGVLRCNQQGSLNVALSQDKLEKYLAGWQYQWPDNGIQSVDFRHSWQAAVQTLADSPHTNALVVIDPPYYSPQQWQETRKDGSVHPSRMTPAYPGHNPQSADEMALCLDCLDAVLDTGKVGRIVVFNYWSKILDDMIQDALISRHCLDFYVSNLGPLGGMNNAQQFHGRDSESVWEIGGRRMFQAHDAIQQGQLFA